MAIPGLTIIGESINDSVPSTKLLFDANDVPGLLALARSQDEKGASYIDVNVGARSPEFMADLVRRIQSVTAKPLSIDTPDPALAEAGLRAYDPERAGGPEADPELHLAAPPRDVRPLGGPAVRPHPHGLGGVRRRRGLRPDEQDRGGHPADGPGPARGGPPPHPRLRERPGHHRPGHRSRRRRLRRPVPARPGVARPHPRRSVLRRRPHVGRPEQFHGHAALQEEGRDAR